MFCWRSQPKLLPFRLSVRSFVPSYHVCTISDDIIQSPRQFSQANATGNCCHASFCRFKQTIKSSFLLSCDALTHIILSASHPVTNLYPLVMISQNIVSRCQSLSLLSFCCNQFACESLLHLIPSVRSLVTDLDSLAGMLNSAVSSHWLAVSVYYYTQSKAVCEPRPAARARRLYHRAPQY